MSDLLCQNMQRRLLEVKVEQLTASECAHLRACPDCRAFARDVMDSGAFLSAVANQVNRQATPELPAALKRKVFNELMARTAQEDGQGAAAPGAAQVVAIAPKAAKARPWRERLDGFGACLRWAAVAAALLIAVSAIAMQAWSGRTIGRLEFASGPTALRTRALDLKHQGVGQWACKLGSSLDTEAKSAALFSVGDGVRVAMAGATSLQIVGAEKIALKSGAVWLSVAKGGKGFKVETPFGLVQVTGTHFGVAVSEKETRVEVTEGSVAVSQARQQGNVIAGQVLRADSGGITAAAPRQEGKNLPLWVNRVLAAEKLAHTGNYLPSIGKR